MNLLQRLFGKKKVEKTTEKQQNFRHITPYKSDSKIYEEIERRQRNDDSLLTNLAIASMLIDTDSNSNSSSSYESKGFDSGFGGGSFLGSGAGSSWDDSSSSSSSYDSGSSSYDSGNSDY